MLGWKRHVVRIGELCIGVRSCLRSLFALFQRIAQFVLAKVSPQDIANSVWASGRLGIKPSDLFDFSMNMPSGSLKMVRHKD
jgi:hypothetical protein